MWLVTSLGNFVEENGLGEVLVAPLDVKLNDNSVFQPGVLYIPGNRLQKEGEPLQAIPALIVEVLSPSTAYYDLVPKYKAYEESSVEEYWIVDPKAQQVSVHVNGVDGFTLLQELTEERTIRSAILEGLEIDAAQLFAKP